MPTAPPPRVAKVTRVTLSRMDWVEGVAALRAWIEDGVIPSLSEDVVVVVSEEEADACRLSGLEEEAAAAMV